MNLTMTRERQKKQFLSPTPYSFPKSQRIKQFLSILSLLTICLFSLSFLFSCSDSSQKTRMEKRISIYLDRLESSAVDLQHELEKIADMKRLNTTTRMRKAITIIEGSEKVLKRANQDISSYIAFINNNSRELKKENLNHYIAIRNLLNRTLSLKRKAIGQYFQEMKKWLNYSATHFKRLEAKDEAARATYDSLLTNVNRCLKKYNTANAKHLQFVNSVLAENQELIKRFKKEYKTMKKELGWM